jgi:hypothetical protein
MWRWNVPKLESRLSDELQNRTTGKPRVEEHSNYVRYVPRFTEMVCPVMYSFIASITATEANIVHRTKVAHRDQIWTCIRVARHHVCFNQCRSDGVYRDALSDECGGAGMRQSNDSGLRCSVVRSHSTARLCRNRRQVDDSPHFRFRIPPITSCVTKKMDFKLIAVHTFAMELMRRAALSGQTDLGVEVYVNRSTKLLRNLQRSADLEC